MLLSAVSFLLIVSMWFLFSWIIFLRTPLVVDDQGQKFTVSNGTSMRTVIHDLYSANIIKHPSFFEMLVYLKGDKHELKAGEYLFPKGTTANSLLMQITTGSGLYYHTFTIIPGWSFSQLRTALMHEDNFRHDSSTWNELQIMKYMGRPDLKAEGQFYPDTYFFLKGSTDLSVLKRAFLRMQLKLQDAWQHRETGLPFATEEDALNAASLVEKEAKVEKDRALIAGVIINRIHKNMPLQIDPTVIYAAGDKFTGTITHSDLVSKNPYNTYVHKGLPPTPIAIPSMNSLQAVLHPAHHDYLYFVANNLGDGAHQFSKTLTEHNVAVGKAKEQKTHAGFSNDKSKRSTVDAKIPHN